MGLPAGWVTDVLPNRRALRVLGNGVVLQQCALALRLLDPQAASLGPSPSTASTSGSSAGYQT